VRRGRIAKAAGKAEEARGHRLLQWLGATVYAIGTTRRRGDYPGTMQTPGLPDKLVFLPGRQPSHVAWRALWWEAKAGTGRLSPAQRAFRACVVRSGCGEYLSGSVDHVLIPWLVREGYLRSGDTPGA
jgi:hypothetical protein